MPKHDDIVSTVKAVRFVRRMRGGSQPSLLECDDGSAYVTKFHWNPQGPNVLANEWIANAMAKSAGLPVPDCAMVKVDKNFILKNPDLRLQSAQYSYMPSPGLHFGSKFLQSDSERSRLLQYLNSSQQSAVEDQHSFTGITLFDLLTESDDFRQALFLKHYNEVRISATFIDFGYHFGGPYWKKQSVHPGPFQYSIRKSPVLWSNSRKIKHWLAIFKKALPYSLSHSVPQVPGHWYNGDIRKMEARYLKRIADFDSIVDGFVAQSFQSTVGSAAFPGREATP